VLAEGIDPRKSHERKLHVAAAPPPGSRGNRTRIGGFLVNGEVAPPK
jgi:hypothetical protein